MQEAKTEKIGELNKGANGVFEIFTAEHGMFTVVRGEDRATAAIGSNNDNKLFFMNSSTMKTAGGVAISALIVDDGRLLAQLRRYANDAEIKRREARNSELVECWECGRTVKRSQARLDGPGWYCGC